MPTRPFTLAFHVCQSEVGSASSASTSRCDSKRSCPRVKPASKNHESPRYAAYGPPAKAEPVAASAIGVGVDLAGSRGEGESEGPPLADPAVEAEVSPAEPGLHRGVVAVVASQREPFHEAAEAGSGIAGCGRGGCVAEAGGRFRFASHCVVMPRVVLFRVAGQPGHRSGQRGRVVTRGSERGESECAREAALSNEAESAGAASVARPRRCRSRCRPMRPVSAAWCARTAAGAAAYAVGES